MFMFLQEDYLKRNSKKKLGAAWNFTGNGTETLEKDYMGKGFIHTGNKKGLSIITHFPL